MPGNHKKNFAIYCILHFFPGGRFANKRLFFYLNAGNRDASFFFFHCRLVVHLRVRAGRRERLGLPRVQPAPPGRGVEAERAGGARGQLRPGAGRRARRRTSRGRSRREREEVSNNNKQPEVNLFFFKTFLHNLFYHILHCFIQHPKGKMSNTQKTYFFSFFQKESVFYVKAAFLLMEFSPPALPHFKYVARTLQCTYTPNKKKKKNQLTLRTTLSQI